MLAPEDRVQLCGRLVVRLGGDRVEDRLPGAQGRALFAYLVLRRDRGTTRDELEAALWPEAPPAAPGTALRALLSKLRGALGPDALDAGSGRLRLPPGTHVDVEAAAAGLHDAESAVAQGRWRRAWVAAHIARNVAARPFLIGHDDVPWVAEQRRRLADTELRALEALAAAGLGLGGPELQTAERAARAIVEAAPYRESGATLLVRALAAQGNRAEAVLAYDALRRRLADDLGMAPAAELQRLHAALVRGEPLSGP